MNRERHDTGFTLLELMVASVLGLILLLTAMTMLFQALRLSDLQEVKPTLNHQAREMFDMLGDGGYVSGTFVPGMRGRLAPDTIEDDNTGGDAPASSPYGSGDVELAVSDASAHRLVLFPGATNQGGQAKLRSSKIHDLSIACNGADDPVPACNSTADATIDGYLYEDPVFYIDGDEFSNSDRSVNDDRRNIANRTIEVTITVIQPYLIGRNALQVDEITETYRTIFTRNDDE
jgi:prepilin-type N-terminal cleavage/methylation domain-containing protein